MLEKLLYLKPGELKRLLPFFILFFLIYSMLNIGEGISLSLFVKRVGAEKLPNYYAFTAIFIFTLSALYLSFVDKISNLNMFKILMFGTLLTYFFAWYMLEFLDGGSWCFGLFLINREVSFTLFIVHFGNFVLDYFSRAELSRMLPLMYSGGRIGGIIGGIILSQLSPIIGVLNLVFVYFLLGVVSLVLLSSFKNIKLAEEPEEEANKPISMFSFLALLIISGFLMWYALNTFFFMISRTFLNFQYNTFFDSYFSSEVKMAQFLGYYTSITLFISLIIQILVVNRVVAYIGLKGGFLLYNVLLTIAVILNLFPMTIYNAAYCRFIETELRLGYRASIVNLIANKFKKNIRAKARALGMGVIIPVATLAGSSILYLLNQKQFFYLIPIVGFIIMLIYLVVTIKLCTYFSEEPKIVKFLQDHNLSFLAKAFSSNKSINTKIQ